MADDDLEETLAELAAAVRELQATIDTDRQGRAVVPPERPDLLAMADEIVIPTLIASLETQIRVLKGIQRGARIARSVETEDRSSRRRGPLREPIESGTSRTVDGIGDALETLADRLGSPENGEVDEILSRTQSLYEDLERRLTDDRIDVDRDRRGTEIQITDDSDPDHDGDPVADKDERVDDRTTIDVEAELETLRDQYGTDRSGPDADEAASGEDGSDDSDTKTDDSPDVGKGESVGDDSVDTDGDLTDRSADTHDGETSGISGDKDESDEEPNGEPS